MGERLDQSVFETSAGQWLRLELTDTPFLFRHRFIENHIGNSWIRSLHGGVTAGITELSAEMAVRLADQAVTKCEVVTNTINYLRVTKDADCLVRANIVRITKRLAFVDVIVWQDDEDQPITHGNCTLRLFRDQGGDRVGISN